jgi:trehalose 6-phosphate synthase
MPPAGGRRSKDAVTGDSDFVVVANRLPIDIERLPDGSTTWKRSPGGLVTALEPLLRRRHGAWVGWPGIVDADEEPIEAEDLQLHPVRLSADDVAEYYEGFSNAALWPLYHDVIVKPIYHREWWDRYVDVNRRFTEAASRAAARGATVWVQDYQLQLVPKMLRELRPDLTIGFFLHIPFPPVELFMQMPWRTEIVEGLLGADLVGFQLAGGAQNFLILSRRLIGASTSRGSVGVRSRFGEVDVDGRTVRVGAFPISIDSSELDSKGRDRNIRKRAREIRAEVGNPRKVLLGVDRLDYTKGIPLRLQAFGQFLDENPSWNDAVTLLQLTPRSRCTVPEYAELEREVATLVGQINGSHAEPNWTPIRYVNKSYSRGVLAGIYRMARVGLVTPLRDGMNLVAKEYVAAQDAKDPGVLILSQFAGAAERMHGALIVNPHEPAAVAAALSQALNMPLSERIARWRQMYEEVITNDIDSWAADFLASLATTRPSGSWLGEGFWRLFAARV